MTAEPTEGERTELFRAIRAQDLEKLRSLLDRTSALASAADPNGLTPLLAAAYFRAPEVVELLIARGARTDEFSSAALGRTAELRAILEARPESARTTSPDGWTALHLAAHFGHDAAIRLLLRMGADLGAVSRNSVANQPLQAAVANRQRAATELLLQAGAQVDARSHGGLTALHLAAFGGDLPTLLLLLEAGADTSARTDAGKTADELAQEGDHREAAWRIQRWGIEAPTEARADGDRA